MAPSSFVPAVNEGTETYKGMKVRAYLQSQKKSVVTCFIFFF